MPPLHNPYRSNILTSERIKREGKLYFPGVCLGKSDYFVFVFSLFFLMFGKRFLGLTHVKVTDGVMWSYMIAYANALYPHKAQGVLLFHWYSCIQVIDYYSYTWKFDFFCFFLQKCSNVCSPSFCMLNPFPVVSAHQHLSTVSSSSSLAQH